MFGDKVKAREQAISGIPVIPVSDGPVTSFEEVKHLVKHMVIQS